MKKAPLTFQLLLAAFCSFAPYAYSMTDKELQELYMSVVEDSAAVFEPLWVDYSEHIPETGFFDVRKYRNWTPDYKGYAGIVTIPANGMAAFCYAVLLTETGKQFFTRKRVPRKVLLEHARKSIRWCCLTSAYVDSPHDYIYKDTHKAFLKGKNWRRRLGYRADEIGWLTLAASKLWKQLDGRTRHLLKQVMTRAAARKRLVRSWTKNQGGNHDQVKQDLSSTMGAAFLFPQHKDAKLFLNAVRGNGIDMVSTLHDRACETKACGRAVKEWAEGWNLYQDYSSDHHGWAQIWYGSDLIFEGRFYVELLSRLTGAQTPQTFTYEGNGYDGVSEWVKRLFLPAGEPLSVHGVEYDSYYGSGVLVYCYAAVFRQDRVASALEERAARLLKRHSRAVRMYDYHRNSWGKAAMAYLIHQHKKRAEPVPLGQAWRNLEGTFHHRWQQNLIHRSPTKVVSFSWGTTSSAGRARGSGVCGFVVPNRQHTPKPCPLIYLHPYSLVGKVQTKSKSQNRRVGPLPAEKYRFNRDDRTLHCAGIVPTGPVRQYCAFFSFHTGPCVFFNRFTARASCTLNWTGVSTAFFVRKSLTPERSFYAGKGRRPLAEPESCSSSWWCVNDVLGMALPRGKAVITRQRSVGRNWARASKYKDKCDIVSVAPVRNQHLEAGQSCGDITAVIYANLAHRQIKKSAKQLQADLPQFPAGLKGVVIPHPVIPGMRFLCLANLQEKQIETTLSMEFPEGAPLLPGHTVIEDKEAKFSVALKPLETFAEICNLYIETTEDCKICTNKQGPGSYVLRPSGTRQGNVLLRYFGRGTAHIVVSTAQKQTVKKISTFKDRETGIPLELRGPLVIHLKKAEFEDYTEPAVQIKKISTPSEGRIDVTVEASDKSGIKQVSLFCDGKLLSPKTEAPYAWNFAIKKGYHTFYATATDNAPGENKRRSFRRTILVP